MLMVKTTGALLLLLMLTTGGQTPAEPKYDLLLRGGHVIDAKNGVDAVRDVAIAGGKIAAVAERIDPKDAFKAVDVAGLHVSPGLIDIHTHVYTGTGEPGSYAGDNSVYPDGFTFRVGVTTVVDAGGAGWRNFEDFKTARHRSSTPRVVAFINIVGNGMRGGKFEQDLRDMEPKPTADMALKHKASSSASRRHTTRARMGARRARRRSGDHRQHSRDGRLRCRTTRAPHSRSWSPRSCGPATSTRTCTPGSAANSIGPAI